MQIFEISPGLFVWSLITFLILVGLLYKFAFNPLMRMQKARQDSIHQAINDAESAARRGPGAAGQLQAATD